MMDTLGVEVLERDLSRLETALPTAMCKIDKTLPKDVLGDLIAFARMLDIARIKGLCELAMYKKYHGYASANFGAAKTSLGFVRTGIEVLAARDIP